MPLFPPLESMSCFNERLLTSKYQVCTMHRCSILTPERTVEEGARGGGGGGEARRTSRHQGQFSSTNFETGQSTSSSCNVLCVAGITSWSLQSNGNASLIRVLKVVTSTSPHAIGIKRRGAERLSGSVIRQRKMESRFMVRFYSRPVLWNHASFRLPRRVIFA